MFNWQRVFITGGTGSFGKVMTKKLLELYPNVNIVIYSRDELKQFDFMNELENDKRVKFIIGDVRDYERLKYAMTGSNFVIHSSALKQVPAGEGNPLEFVKTNINGAENVARASVELNISKVIALSTDKASNPVNLYGATKLVSDKIFTSYNNNALHLHRDTILSVVRYGNVANSRGSVIPFFKQKIKENADALPVTSKDMTRFLISISYAVQFVIGQFYSMKGGEIFVPKLPSVNMFLLAEVMKTDKMKIEIIGVRDGEKLSESMISETDSFSTVDDEDYYTIYQNLDNVDKNSSRDRLVPKGFTYESGTNPEFLSSGDIQDFLDSL